MNKIKIILCVLLQIICLSAIHAYRIELSVASLPGTQVFLAGYYGEQVVVIDSTVLDHSGSAVFGKPFPLCTGIYTIVAPGKILYDFLLDDHQAIKINMDQMRQVKIEGGKQAEAYARYSGQVSDETDRRRLAEKRNELIREFPGTFLSAYLSAMQTITPRDTSSRGRARSANC